MTEMQIKDHGFTDTYALLTLIRLTQSDKIIWRQEHCSFGREIYVAEKFDLQFFLRLQCLGGQPHVFIRFKDMETVALLAPKANVNRCDGIELYVAISEQASRLSSAAGERFSQYLNERVEHNRESYDRESIFRHFKKGMENEKKNIELEELGT